MIFDKKDSIPTPASYSDKGFTLAETLITLVIIGVVAALTVPTMIMKHQKDQTVTRIKKTYASLAQTTVRAISDYGNVKNWEMKEGSTPEITEDFVKKYMLPYMAVAKDCGFEITGDCEFKYNGLDGSVARTVGYSYYRFYLNDGTLIAVVGTVNLNAVDSHRKYATVFIDINGQKGPNKSGRDIFGFDYFVDGNYPELNGKFVPRFANRDRETLISNETSMCNKNQNGDACLALIMKDSWQIKDDYPW